MKNRHLRHFVWLFLTMLGITQSAMAEFKDFAVIVNNQSGTLLTSNEQVQGTAVNFGVAVASDGTVSRVDAGDASSVATISGTYHSDHGCTNLTVVVPVDGNVKITVGQCTYSGNDITVKNTAGTTVATKTPSKACWKNNRSNVTELYYTGEATTLTISGMSYCPYVAVEAVSSTPTTCTITYSLGEVTAEGILPSADEITAGENYTFPKNYTLYKENYTLTGWTDGTKTYAAGEEITLESDLALTPVFTANTVSLAERTEAVTVKWNLEPQSGVPAISIGEGQEGFRVAQATVNGTAIDVKMSVDNTYDDGKGKLNNSGRSSWCQANINTKITIPSAKGAVVSMLGYAAFGADGKTATTVEGQSTYDSNTTLSYTVGGKDESVDIILGDDCGYLSYVQVVLPIPESNIQEKAIIDTNFQDWTKSSTTSEITTNFSKEDITFTYVNTSVDPDATNEGKFPTTTDAAYKGYIMSGKSEATVTTTAFNNITKIRYRHGATGSNRGWGLKVKGDGDGDWVTISSEVTGSTAWIEKEINRKNVQLQWYNLNTSQNAYMFELEVYANVEITAEQVTLTTAVSPEGAGTVTVKPYATEYDINSEVTLTAAKNFGYKFKQWTQGGVVLGTEPTLNYTIAESSTLTAEFEAVTTYQLTYTVDGTNDYMVQPSPAPTVVDGKNMYEEGTTVTLTANQYEGLVTFNNWSSGETSAALEVKMTENKTVTAVYSEADIIAGWDFYKAGNNGRKADFAATDNDADALILVNTSDGTTSGWLDKSTLAGGGYESFKGAAVNWRTGSGNGDVGNYHWQTKVNAEAFTDINVQFQMLYNYNAYQKYNAEYSLNGTDWTNFGSITMEGAKKVASFSNKLPEAVNNKKDLYIRMLADKTSEVDGTASANDGNTLAMFFITGTPKLVDDPVAPTLVSSVPAEGATGVSAAGKIVLTFDKKVKVADGTKGNLSGMELTPVVSGKTITFAYKGLDYNKQYNFTLAANTISNLTDVTLTDKISINFTTMARPSVTKALYDQVVSDVDELVAAIKVAESRSDKNARYRIFIKNGEYTIPLSSTMKTVNGYEVPECITFISGSNISFIGESRDGVIITNGIDKNATFAGQYGTTSKYDGIGNSDVFQTSGSGLYWQDLTIETGMDDATGRDLAIHDKGTKTIYKNIGLRGFQDTWTSNNQNGLYYFEGGYVRGRTDYMCGKGDAFFNGIELRQIAGGYAAVPSTPAKIGWVYKDCVINGESAKLKYEDTKPATAESADGNYTLGRPWGQGTPVAVFIDTKMNVVPSATGWSEMSGGYPARFAEYNSTTSTGSVIDLSGRKTTFAETHENNPVLTAEEAAAYSDMSKMFGEWDPTLATEQAPVPTGLQVSGMTLTWNTSDYALLWAVCKDGTVIDFTTDNTYTAAETGSYSIRAANEMGGLSEASEAVTVNGSTTVIIPAKEKTTYVTATALDFSNVAGMKAYIAVRATETKVVLQEAGAVPAETPLVLIVETPKQEYTIPAATSADAVTGNLLKAGDGATVIGGASRYDYVLKDGVFRRAAEGTVDKGKAYLHLEADQLPNATAAAELTISFGEGTDIKTVGNRPLNIEDNEVYNLNGQRVAKPQKGIYLVNGKKVIIK